MTQKLLGDRYVDLTEAEESALQQRRTEYNQEQESLSRLSYKDNRRQELSKLDGDGMDAMRKALIGLFGENVSEDFAEYIEKVNQIKNKYPKPQT